MITPIRRIVIGAAGEVARLGLLGLFTPELGARSVSAVREGLGELGWHEGQNIHFTHRYASGKRDQLTALAAELVVVSRLMWKIGRRSSGIRLIVASGAG